MKCYKCGAESPDNSLFCMICGADFSNAQQISYNSPNQQNNYTDRQNSYNQQSSYDQQGSYNQQSSYDQQGSYNQQSSYDQQGSYNQQSSYGQQGSYNQQSSYNQQGSYNQQSSYNQQGSYNQQSSYNQQDSYNQQSSYPSQQPTDSGPGNSEGKSKALLIPLIIISVLIVAAVVVIVVILTKKEPESTADTTPTTETASSDTDDKKSKKKDEMDSKAKDNDKTEEKKAEVSTEAATEATTEAVTEAPRPAPYGEEKAIKFSTTEDSTLGIPYTRHYYTEDYDNNDNPTPIETDKIEIEKSGFTNHINSVLVTEPDSNGNVTYYVDYYTYKAVTLIDNLEGNKYCLSNSMPLILFDYYTGYRMPWTNTVSDIQNKYTENYSFDVYDDIVNISLIETSEVYNYLDEKNETDRGTEYKFVYQSKFVFIITAPKDYDGLVFALYNKDVIPERYEKEVQWQNEMSQKLVSNEKVDGYKSKFLEKDDFGYEDNVDDYLYIRLSDCAVPADPESIAALYSSFTLDYYFEWYENALAGDPGMGGEKLLDQNYILGAWDCYMIYDREKKMDSFGEKYATVTLSPSGSDMEWAITDASVRWDGEEEWTYLEEPETYIGHFNEDGTMTFNPETEGVNFKVYGFYTNGYMQYAVGTMMMQSGETADVFLMRP